jgi:NADPH-dependent 7-cyano-7-deazaguanine reductase QueF
MSIISFNLTKLSGERKSSPAGKLSVTNQTNLKDVQERPIGNQKALLFSFVHTSKYNPDYATLVIEGEVLVLSNEKQVKETIDSFKAKKTFDPALTQRIFNTILNRVSIEALVLSKDLNLPAPFKLPRIDLKVAPQTKETKPAAKGKK